MYFKNQKFLVAGMSRSGEACVRFLLARGATVYMYDDVVNETVRSVMGALEDLGAFVVTAESYDEVVKLCDVLVISPGIPIDNALPVAFRRQKKSILGEEELGAMYLRATAIAVTGTNGKTTTVSMIEHALKTAGLNAVACGNIGNPLVRETEKLNFDDYAVVEISSFQLETLSLLRPHVAVITNITEDHLNRHYNMENYVFLKSKILRGLRESEFAVLNYDDERVREMTLLTKAEIVFFSVKNQLERGACIKDGYLCFGGERYILADELSVGGIHNVYNALACIAVCAVMGVEKEHVVAALKSFKGVKHRVEFVKTVNGINYINDSKATNVDATLKAIESMKQATVLLVGGKDKGYEYQSIFESAKNGKITQVILYGENRFKVLDGAIKSGYSNFSMCKDFNTAVRLANLTAKSGQCVLLSPASASYDEFSNYEERGEAFIKLVEKFDEQTAEE